MRIIQFSVNVDWLQFLKQFVINVSLSCTCSQSNSNGSVLKQSFYNSDGSVLVFKLKNLKTKTEPSEIDWLQVGLYDVTH